jgi:hypothetical protein
MTAGCKSDDCVWEDNTGCSDCSEDSVDLNRLPNQLNPRGEVFRLTSFFSNGVPSIGTKVLTGKDSG